MPPYLVAGTLACRHGVTMSKATFAPACESAGASLFWTFYVAADALGHMPWVRTGIAIRVWHATASPLALGPIDRHASTVPRLTHYASVSHWPSVP
jgi:hypothetical protein